MFVTLHKNLIKNKTCNGCLKRAERLDKILEHIKNFILRKAKNENDSSAKS